MARMYQVKSECQKCGNRLYKTNLTGRIWCKHCREYQDVEQNGGILKWLGRTK